MSHCLFNYVYIYLQKPEPKKPFISVFDATFYRRACPTYDLVKNLKPEEFKDAEDCLHLSIYSLEVSKKPLQGKHDYIYIFLKR